MSSFTYRRWQFFPCLVFQHQPGKQLGPAHVQITSLVVHNSTWGCEPVRRKVAHKLNPSLCLGHLVGQVYPVNKHVDSLVIVAVLSFEHNVSVVDRSINTLHRYAFVMFRRHKRFFSWRQPTFSSYIIH